MGKGVRKNLPKMKPTCQFKSDMFYYIVKPVS